MLTITKAAPLLGLSRDRLWKLLRQGDPWLAGAFRTAGGHWRIPEYVIDRIRANKPREEEDHDQNT